MSMTPYTIRKTDFALLRFDGATWSETGVTLPTDMREHGLVAENAELYLWCWRAGSMQLHRWDGAAFVITASLPGAPRPCGSPVAVNGCLAWPASTRRPTPDTCIVWDGKVLKTGAVPLRAGTPVPEATMSSFELLATGRTDRIVPRGGVQYPDGSIVFWGCLKPVSVALSQGQLLANAPMPVQRFGLLNPADGPAVAAARAAIDKLVVHSFDHLGREYFIHLDWTIRDIDGKIVWACPDDAVARTVTRKVADVAFDWLGARILDAPGAVVIGVDSAGDAVAALADGTVVALPETFTALGGLGGDFGARPEHEVAVRPCLNGADVLVIGGGHRASVMLDAQASTPTYVLRKGTWELTQIELLAGRPDHAAVEASFDQEDQRLHVLALNRATRLWHHYIVENSAAVLDMGIVYRQGQEALVPTCGSLGLHRADGTKSELNVVGITASQLTVAIKLTGTAGLVDVTVALHANGDTVASVTAPVTCSPGGSTSMLTLAHQLAAGTPFTIDMKGVRK